MAPNAARLIVAPEDELEFGKELGAGAFGTVHEVSNIFLTVVISCYNERVIGNLLKMEMNTMLLLKCSRIHPLMLVKNYYRYMGLSLSLSFNI